MNQKQRMHLQETTLRLLAEGVASRVTFRWYENGNSHDTTLDATTEDRAGIFPVAYGALLGLNFGETARSGSSDDVVLNTAEFTLAQLQPCVNTYDTIYNPLRAILEAWRIASGSPRSALSDWASRAVWSLFPAWLDLFDDLMAYAQDDEWGPVETIADAETTLEGWRECGIADDMPAQDAGLMLLLWNLYVSDHAAGKKVV